MSKKQRKLKAELCLVTAENIVSACVTKAASVHPAWGSKAEQWLMDG